MAPDASRVSLKWIDILEATSLTTAPNGSEACLKKPVDLVTESVISTPVVSEIARMKPARLVTESVAVAPEMSAMALDDMIARDGLESAVIAESAAVRAKAIALESASETMPDSDSPIENNDAVPR
jgi:hypothetical protein